MIRTLLADDHGPTREELARVLTADGRFEVCALAADAPEAIRLAVATEPDLCVLDVNMPGGGVAAAWEVCARLPAARVVMLTVSDDDRDVFPALRAGAHGYLLKDMDPAALPAALADACAGAAAIPRTLMGRVLESLRTREARRRPLAAATSRHLTARQWETMDLLARGLTTGQVARRLCLSEATVRSHAATATERLGAPDRETALEAFRRGRTSTA